MSNVVVNSQKQIFTQKVNNIENSRVNLPFNVSKNQVGKLRNIFDKAKIDFYAESDKLDINSIYYGNVYVQAPKAIMPPSRITLAKTYVVTMSKKFSEKAVEFYKKVVPKKQPENPVFGITKELNLQEALKIQQEAIQEATTEIDLTELNNALNADKKLPELQSTPESQVLANSPLGETVIENPVNLNNQEQQAIQPTQVQPSPELAVQGEVKTLAKKRGLRGNVLVVPIVIIWLGIVLIGTIKGVTAIMS